MKQKNSTEKNIILKIIAISLLIFAIFISGCDSSDSNPKNTDTEKSTLESFAISSTDSESQGTESDTDAENYQSPETEAMPETQIAVDTAETLPDTTEAIPDTDEAPSTTAIPDSTQPIESEEILPDTTEASTESLSPSQGDVREYLLNTNTKKFHETTCKRGPTKESNKAYKTATRDEIISMGYSPCAICKP